MENKNNNESIDISYAFIDKLTKKNGEIYSKMGSFDELTIYEEPRWTYKDTKTALDVIKQNVPELYKEIQDYAKEQGCKETQLYIDFGKSLRYDDTWFDWSNEILEDKLDNRFIIRYSSENDEGNIGNGGEEVILNDEHLVSKLNLMIQEHVKNNIENYNEYKKLRNELVDKELSDKHNNALDVYYEDDLKNYTDYAPLPEKTNPENQIIRVQEGQLTEDLEVLLGLKREGDVTHNFGWFKYEELDKNGLLVKDYPVVIWNQRQDEEGNPFNPPKIDTKDISHVIFSQELIEKIDNNLKQKIEEVSQNLVRENFEKVIHDGKFSDFEAQKTIEAMKTGTFKEFETIGKLTAGKCDFNLCITKGGVPEEPWIDISPVRTIDGIDIDGTVSLSLSDILEPTETLSLEEQIKNTIIRKIDELDSFTDTQKTILTTLGVNWKQYINKAKNLDDEVSHSLNKPFIPSEYVLNKLQEKGIEVVTDKEKFNELINASEILQKMEGNKKENLSDKYFQANQSESEAFSKELDAFIADYDKSKKTINPLKMLNVGSISPVMKLLGIADVPVGIDQSTISKALREEPIYPDDEQGHKLTIDELKNIPQSLADPVMVFYSDSPIRRQRDGYVFFTEQKDEKGNSIIIPVAVNKRYGRLVINKVTSIYGKDHEIGYVKNNIKRGNLVYYDKKRSLDWERECKVQFLAQVLPIESSINNILSKDSLVKFLDSKSEKMVKDGITYGFSNNGKIYLNPDVLSTEAAMHEYTHLWDNIIRKDNPELWNKGLEIFKGTSIWNEIVNDENYKDIKDDENLVLSECHAQITGKVAESVLNRIAELDGNEKQAEMIDWDKETIEFIFENYRDVFEKNSFNSVAEFTTAAMKDLFSPIEQQKKDISIDSSAFERMEKFFEGKHSELGNADYQTFPELYDFVKEEFPNQNTLLEAVSRMVYSNVNFGDLEPASYDDVYGFGDGAEQRFDVSDDIAKRLINNEISPDWMTIQK